MSFTSDLTGGLIADAPNYAGMAKRSEARRKGVINLGLEQLNAIFGGGSAPFYSLARDPMSKSEWRGGGNKNVYYHQNKKGEFVPYFAPKSAYKGKGLETGTLAGAGIGTAVMPGVGTVVGASLGGIAGSLADKDYKGAALSIGTGGGYGLAHKAFGWGDQPTPREMVNKKIKRELLFNAPETKTFTGYGDPFFEARRKAYMDFALPQVADQYRQTRDNILYSMANRGLLRSTQNQRAMSDLERQSGNARQAVGDEAINQSNALEQAVEAIRQQAIQQLYQTADPAQAMMQAISASKQFERPAAFAPIANAMGNVGAMYANDQMQRRYRTQLQDFEDEMNKLYTAPI